MTRRRFAFWLGLGIFTLGEKLHANSFDDLAAAVTRGWREFRKTLPASLAEHWTVANNKRWWWYERQNWVDGQWVVTGIATPIDKKTGQPLEGKDGYLDHSLVPEQVRVVGTSHELGDREAANDSSHEGLPDPARRARHGRPPSKWLRSLYADELRIWLKTIDVPAAGVSGMTFWDHLTDDHSFDPDKIDGLTIDEQAQLHAAAHYGY